jgi:AcrR family transcriptional regulator
MSTTPYELAGRSRQKLRTRNALVAAARDLVAQGRSPTVEDAAAAAAVSRTTAYRYFANQAQLLAAAHPETEATSLLPRAAPQDPTARLAAVIARLTHIVLETEPQQRTMLRLSLEPEHTGPLVLRQGRAIRWIEEALEPLRDRLPPAHIRRLTLAIRTAVGIEALVWLTDVAGLPRKEAVKLMRWSAAALLRGALAESATSESRRRPDVRGKGAPR